MIHAHSLSSLLFPLWCIIPSGGSLRNGDCFVVRYDVGADVDVVDSFHMRDEEEETTSGDTLVCFSPCEDNVVLVSSPWSNECILSTQLPGRGTPPPPTRRQFPFHKATNGSAAPFGNPAPRPLHH